MKTVTINRILAACLTILVSLPAMAQEDALKAFPGYVDFGELNSLFGEPTVQISVGESLLGLVGSLSASEDPETAEMFKRLNGVRVSVFENEGMVDGAVGLIKDVSSNLARQGWESVVTVNSDDEQVRIFMMINDSRVEGITVMALDEEEAVFVNIIGNIDPEELSKVMDNFNIDLNGNGHDSDDSDD
jgi:hypothetical protein